jgi:hypothetical protein
MKNKNDNNLSAGLCQAIMSDATDIIKQLSSLEGHDLPTWWTSKLAVASAYINSLRDYITYNTDDILEEAGEESKEEEAETSEPEEASMSLEDILDTIDEMLPPSARMMKNAIKAG